MRGIRLDPRFPFIIDPIPPVPSGIRWDPRSNPENFRGIQWDPRATVELHHGIRMDHVSNTALSREIFWDHRSDFGIHGNVCFTLQYTISQSGNLTRPLNLLVHRSQSPSHMRHTCDGTHHCSCTTARSTLNNHTVSPAHPLPSSPYG